MSKEAKIHISVYSVYFAKSNALISGHQGRGGVDPREPLVICTSTFTNPSYPKPRFFDKKLLTTLPWGQRSVLCQVKEFYRRNHSFLLKNIVTL